MLKWQGRRGKMALEVLKIHCLASQKFAQNKRQLFTSSARCYYKPRKATSYTIAAIRSQCGTSIDSIRA